MKTVIGIMHNEPVDPGGPFSEASTDVLTQVHAIGEALQSLGHPWAALPFHRDFSPVMARIAREGISPIVNLCETVDEEARLCGHPAAMLEVLGLPFTGSPAIALMLTTDKLLTKRLLKASRCMTPDYVFYDGTRPLRTQGLTYPVIVKPRFEDASIGIDQDSVFECEEDLRKVIQVLFDRFGDLIVEEYIRGREFNVSLLGYPEASPLPPAEIDFSGFPGDLHRIVGYRAKWEKTSFEYQHTPRRFVNDLSPALLKALQDAASFCFRFFMLRDYGRVDMRVNETGKVYVLEVNANPCLSPDAGFAAAAEHAGWSYRRLVETLLSFVTQRTADHADQVPYER